MIDDQREAIKAGEDPDYSFPEFMEDYLDYTKKYAIGEHTDRAISLESSLVKKRKIDDVNVRHIMPNAGKQGKPVILMNQSGKKHKYGPENAALYGYHIFVYENSDDIIVIFHRQNGSGCKSVFLETANKAIRSKGIKLDMTLIIPLIDEVDNSEVHPTKITLQFTRQYISSDIADNIDGPQKKQVIRELVLNLEEPENFNILNIVRRFLDGDCDRANAFALIKNELHDADDYDDAELKMKIGSNRYRTVGWSDFEKIIGTHDITQRLYEAWSTSHDFEGELSVLADEYYGEIIESEEV